MKRVVWTLGVMLLAAAGWGQATAPQKMPPAGSDAQPVAVLLEQGVYQEETAGNLEAAARTYHQIVEQATVTRGLVAQALYRLAVVQAKQKQPAEAALTVARLKQEYPEQKDLIAKAEAALPGGVGPSGLASASSHSQPPTPEEKAQSAALVAQGGQLMQDRKFDAACKAFYQATLKDPTSVSALNGWGWAILNSQGDPKQAFEKALEQDPKSAAALNGLGWLSRRNGNRAEAVEYWRRALDSDGSATSAMSGLAQYDMEQGRYDEAAVWYDKWLKIDPQNADANIGISTAKGMQVVMKDATATVNDFLKKLDDAQYAESWRALDAHSPLAQSGDQPWDEFMKIQRAPLGKVVARKLDKSQVNANGRGGRGGGRGNTGFGATGGGGGRGGGGFGSGFGPGGASAQDVTSATFQFITQFDHKKDVYEYVDALKNDNGEWRIYGYLIQTPQLGVDPLKAR